jgi:hypothetical protein
MQEYISAAVDQNLDRSVQSEFIQHIRHCIRCASEYDLELATKHMVQSRLQFVETPPTVRSAILEKIKAESAISISHKPWWEGAYRWFYDLFSTRHLLPAASMAMIIMIIVGVALIMHPSGSRNGQSSLEGIADENSEVLHQAVDNYDNIQNGKVTLQLASSEPSDVKAFFQDKVDFDVDVHHLKSARLIGAGYSEYKGAKLAHIMYKSGDRIIYVYQVWMKDIENSSGLCARNAIHSALVKKEIFTDSIKDSHHQCCMVVWEERGILCSAVSPLPKNEMLMTLQDQLDPDPR